jgi:hypoxanthine phosphoribosyltransferase
MPELIPVLGHKEIHARVKQMGQRLSSDYQNCHVVMVCVLKGALMFTADLVRTMSIDVEIDFLRVSSYGGGTHSSGRIQLTKDIETSVVGKHVVIVEDIVDTGLTLAALIDHLRGAGAVSVKVCAMIDKHERRESEVIVDYACHRVDSGFLVGYGLDFNEAYRGLPEIYHLKFSESEGAS